MMKHNFAVKASLFTLILALIAIGTFAAVAVMKKDVETKTQTSTNYFYNGPSNNLATDVMNPALWGTSQAAGLSCGHETQIPCSIPVESGKTISQRLTELNDLSGVQGATTTRRNPSF